MEEEEGPPRDSEERSTGSEAEGVRPDEMWTKSLLSTSLSDSTQKFARSRLEAKTSKGSA